MTHPSDEHEAEALPRRDPNATAILEASGGSKMVYAEDSMRKEDEWTAKQVPYPQ